MLLELELQADIWQEIEELLNDPEYRQWLSELDEEYLEDHENEVFIQDSMLK